LNGERELLHEEVISAAFLLVMITEYTVKLIQNAGKGN
jgi:hypothetical protein